MHACRHFYSYFPRVAVAIMFVCCGDWARADLYSDAVLALEPDHYYRLNEDNYGQVTDIGTNPFHGVHEGLDLFGAYPEVGENLGFIGAPGPDVTADGTPLLGFDEENVSLFGNNALAVNLGPGEMFAHTTMTVATWFKAPCDPENPGVECSGAPASHGGERIFSNNFPAQDTGGASDLDDLGHLQIDFGLGANLVISIDNRFNQPLKSNFQVAHGDLVVKDNNWHHLVVSRNGDELSNILLVVDGVEITQDRWVDSTDSWEITEPYDARIGTRTTAPHDHTFNGWIDETAIWLGRQLTVEEAQSMWLAALGETGGGGVAGDYNNSGTVEQADLDLVLLNWGQAETPNGWVNDLPEGNVDQAELDGVLLNWGNSAEVAAASVPEPTTWAMGLVLFAAAMTAALVGRGRRSQRSLASL
jgi:hypothetical protein